MADINTIVRPTSPHETLAWGQRTLGNQNACKGLLRDISRRRKARWYIQFSLKGARDSRGRYPKAAWPLLFNSREDAERYAAIMPTFVNGDATTSRGRIISYSIEVVRR